MDYTLGVAITVTYVLLHFSERMIRYVHKRRPGASTYEGGRSIVEVLEAQGHGSADRYYARIIHVPVIVITTAGFLVFAFEADDFDNIVLSGWTPLLRIAYGVRISYWLFELRLGDNTGPDRLLTWLHHPLSIILTLFTLTQDLVPLAMALGGASLVTELLMNVTYLMAKHGLKHTRGYLTMKIVSTIQYLLLRWIASAILSWKFFTHNPSPWEVLSVYQIAVLVFFVIFFNIWSLYVGIVNARESIKIFFQNRSERGGALDESDRLSDAVLKVKLNATKTDKEYGKMSELVVLSRTQSDRNFSRVASSEIASCILSDN